MLLGLGVDGVVLLYVAHRLALIDGRRGGGRGRRDREPDRQHALRHADDRRDVLRAAVRRLPEPAAARASHRAQHGRVRRPHAGARTGAAAAITRAGRQRRGVLEWPGFADWVADRRRPLLWTAALLTLVLGAAATRLQVNASLDRLKVDDARSAVRGADPSRVRTAVRRVHVCFSKGRRSSRCSTRTNALLARPAATGARARRRRRLVAAALRRGAAPRARRHPAERRHRNALRHLLHRERASGRFRARQPAAVRRSAAGAARSRFASDLSTDFASHGLGDLIRRFIVQTPQGWMLASYAFPADAASGRRSNASAAAHRDVQLTGLTLVNENSRPFSAAVRARARRSARSSSLR